MVQLVHRSFIASSEDQLEKLVANWLKETGFTSVDSTDSVVRENGKTFILRDITAH